MATESATLAVVICHRHNSPASEGWQQAHKVQVFFCISAVITVTVPPGFFHYHIHALQKISNIVFLVNISPDCRLRSVSIETK